MSYPSPDNDGFLQQLLAKKEIYMLKKPPPTQDDASIGLQLQSHQLFAQTVMRPDTGFKSMHFSHACHPAGTEIVMYNGRVKTIENIEIGDRIMGDDSTPRTVQRLYRGNDMIYRIMPHLSEPFLCNAAHMLVVYYVDAVAQEYGRPSPEIISVTEFLKLPQRLQSMALLKTAAVEFPGGADIADAADAGRGASSIPDIYKYGSSKTRRAFLDGVLDAANSCHVPASPGYAQDLLYLCRSMGVLAQYDPYTALVTVYPGDSLIPFKVSEQFFGKYYGFELDGNRRYLLSSFIITHNTGTGKTLLACSIGHVYNQLFARIYAQTAIRLHARKSDYIEMDRLTPSIFVLGFSGPKAAFTRELTKYPEFGFISVAERDMLNTLTRVAAAGTDEDKKNLKDFISTIKRRITMKSKGGFYKFYGYEELVNKLFQGDVNLTEYETAAEKSLTTDNPRTLYDIIRDEIAAGRVRVNTRFLNGFVDSLIICDEIHNTYNMNMKNNRGVAIQYILDTVPSVKLVTLSATPINGSPTEAVELVNYHSDTKYSKRDFFDASGKISPENLARLGRVMRGKISFLQDSDIRYYPARIFVGESAILPRETPWFGAGSAVPYLKFTKCDMSAMHYATHMESRAGNESEYTVSTDGYAIYDLVFPNPESDEIGIYRTSDIRNKLYSAPREWMDKTGVVVRKTPNGDVLTGAFLARANVGKYSTKMATLLDTLDEIAGHWKGRPDKCQKIMIYHNRVKVSGAILLQEVLLQNGFADETSEHSDATKCVVCWEPFGKHGDDHKYYPARFVVAHSYVDHSVMLSSINKYNSPTNAHGLEYLVIIGSKIIKESYEIKDVQNMIIVSPPVNIPTMMQVFGRCIRNKSHMNLPPEQWRVFIRILVTTIAGDISPELYRYAGKISDYMTIQQIEREWNRNAIDANIHRDTIMSESILRTYFPDGRAEPVATIGNLYFDPAEATPEYRLEQLDVSTFNAYGFNRGEVSSIIYVIKRLYMREYAYTYDDLWAAVRNPGVRLEINPALFSESNFIIALDALTSSLPQIIKGISRTESREPTEIELMYKLFDPAERFIYARGKPHSIVHIDKYYILFPIRGDSTRVLAEYVNGLWDPSRRWPRIGDSTIMVDVETYLRPPITDNDMRVNLAAYAKTVVDRESYYRARDEFIRGKHDDYALLFDYADTFQQAIIEDIIAGDPAIPNEIGRAVLNMYSDFKVIITAEELAKYKDTVKQYKNGIPTGDPARPLGYVGANLVRLYDPNAGWMEVSKLSVNKQVTYKENDVVIGYIETVDGSTKFKLRRPMHQMKQILDDNAQSKSSTTRTTRTAVADTRLIERGIVCDTKNKQALVQIMTALGVPMADIRREQLRVKKMCGIIKLMLIRLEIAERQTRSRVKYFYGWWDNVSNLSSLI